MILIVFTILARIIGFARDVLLSYYYGASAVSDAYVISLTIPTTIFVLLSMAVAMNYIPMYTQIAQKEGASAADGFSSGMYGFLILLSGVAGAAVFLFARPAVSLFASGFHGETFELAVLLTRIGVGGVLFSGMSTILCAHLQIKNHFFIPALSDCFLNLMLAFFIVLGARIDVRLLAIGILSGPALQFALMAGYMRRKNWLCRPSFRMNDPAVKSMVLLILPVLLGISVDQVNALVDRAFASGIAEGGVSAMNYAFKVSGFVHGIFAFSIGTAAYPAISRMASQKDYRGLKKATAECLNGINLFAVPSAVALLFFALPVVGLLFGRGSFDSAALAMTSDALAFYSVGIAAMGMGEVLARVFYSMKDVKTPLLISAASIAANAGLNALLSGPMGIGGLALATSLSMALRTVLLSVYLRRKTGGLGMRNLSVSFCKILCASAAMGVCARLVYAFFTGAGMGGNVSLILSAVTGAAVYLLLILLMKVKNVRSIMTAVKKRLPKTV